MMRSLIRLVLARLVPARKHLVAVLTMSRAFGAQVEFLGSGLERMRIE